MVKKGREMWFRGIKLNNTIDFIGCFRKIKKIEQQKQQLANELFTAIQDVCSHKKYVV